MLVTDPDNTLYDDQNPYANRDLRFYQSIVYNGSEWEGNIMSMVTNTVDDSKSGLCKPVLGKARCGYGPANLLKNCPLPRIYMEAMPRIITGRFSGMLKYCSIMRKHRMKHWVLRTNRCMMP